MSRRATAKTSAAKGPKKAKAARGGIGRGIYTAEGAPPPPVTFAFEEETVRSVLRDARNALALSEDDVERLVEAAYWEEGPLHPPRGAPEYPAGRKFLTLEDRGFLYEIASLPRMIGIEETMKYIAELVVPEFYVKHGPYNEARDILLTLPTLKKERDALAFEAVLLQTKEEGVKGVGKCNRCGSIEIMFIEMQTRSADEPATIFSKCVHCGKRWRS